ncbi:hypothetical protein DDF62_22200 [Caulobacter radicis]|uniref:hypothetical protein n=1 Tax=Caulobacter radicis TaxID=2172650 RepID=UPI000D5679D2|nr:hypothetical protein [Caulobacter radicis]PVM84448.1 hypothetical protein DDF62_22200 [Caulobacter radicis]
MSILPGAPAPQAFSGLKQSRSGEIFAFARFGGRGCALDVALRGAREPYPCRDDVERLTRDSIHVRVSIGSHAVGSAHFKRFSVLEDRRLIDPMTWSSHMTEVHADYRRRGAGLALYGMMKACGIGVRPSTTTRSEGRALWRRLDPSITHFPSTATEPACDDLDLIARCVLDFTPWRDASQRMRACQSLADIEALGPATRPYLEAVSTVTGWPGRDLGAARVFAQLGDYDNERDAIGPLKLHGMPAWSIWSLRMLAARDPGPARRILQAYRAARSALLELDEPMEARFSDYKIALSEWPDCVDASPPSNLGLRLGGARRG